jgi:2-aminoadipate transaminase
LPKIIKIYKPKQEAMFQALRRYLPDGFRWSKPEGGMFIWAEGPEGIDMEKIYWKSIERKVAFVPGKFFFTRKGDGIETMRLNYTMADEEGIDRAVKTLSEVIKQEV